eukprot:89753-Rhodomonas_salina.1
MQQMQQMHQHNQVQVCEDVCDVRGRYDTGASAESRVMTSRVGLHGMTLSHQNDFDYASDDSLAPFCRVRHSRSVVAARRY